MLEVVFQCKNLQQPLVISNEKSSPGSKTLRSPKQRKKGMKKKEESKNNLGIKPDCRVSKSLICSSLDCGYLQRAVPFLKEPSDILKKCPHQITPSMADENP